MSSTIPAAGGSESVTVTAARECQWTAAADVDWLSVASGSTGQGDGTVQFTAAANPDPIARSGSIVVNGQRSAVAQAAAECRFDLSPTSADFPSSGGTGTVRVSASSQRCTWTVASDVGWITTASGSGAGSAAVTFQVAPADGPSRRGTLRIAGQTVTVNQDPSASAPAPTPPTPAPTPPPTPTPTPTPAPAPTPPPAPACSFAVGPQTIAEDSAGGMSMLAVTAGAGCQWTAAANVSWIAVASGASGTGNGSVQLDVQPNTGPARTGTATVAGLTVTINQAALACTYEVAPKTVNADHKGGHERVSVLAPSACTWTAVSSVPWITITSGASGSGNGIVNFNVAEAHETRQGTLLVAGQTVTVEQKGRDK